MTPILVAIVAQILFSLILVIWTRSKVRRFLGSDDEIDRIRREIGALIVELDSSADRNVTVLEDRLSALKEMVADADKRIGLLGQERPRRQAEGAVYDRLGRSSENRKRPAHELEPGSTIGKSTGSTGPVDRGYAAIVPPVERSEESRRSEPELPFIRFSEKPLSIEEPFADSVLSLARRGFSSDIIAARLGTTIAEVDLVLSLEQERGGRSKEP